MLKKILMQYYAKNKTHPVTPEMLSKIINENKKYKFSLDSQENEALKKLMNDITIEVEDYNNLHAKMVTNRIIHAIHIASTSRDTTPTANRQIDFWNLNNQWKNKTKKTKYTKVIGHFHEDQTY